MPVKVFCFQTFWGVFDINIDGIFVKSFLVVQIIGLTALCILVHFPNMLFSISIISIMSTRWWNTEPCLDFLASYSIASSLAVQLLLTKNMQSSHWYYLMCSYQFNCQLHWLPISSYIYLCLYITTLWHLLPYIALHHFLFANGTSLFHHICTCTAWTVIVHSSPLAVICLSFTFYAYICTC